MVEIKNEAGETITEASSDAEAARWWLDSGRRGDYLADTGELMSVIADSLGFDFGFDRNGCVTTDSAVKSLDPST